MTGLLQPPNSKGLGIPIRSYFFFPGLCDNALPAAILLALLVLPSRRTFEAADAALALVTFFAFPINVS